MAIVHDLFIYKILNTYCKLLPFFFTPGNIALDKKSDTAQSTTKNNDFKSANGVDGELAEKGDCVSTDGPGSGSFPPSWWRLDLKSQHSVHNVTVYARKGNCC